MKKIVIIIGFIFCVNLLTSCDSGVPADANSSTKTIATDGTAATTLSPSVDTSTIVTTDTNKESQNIINETTSDSKSISTTNVVSPSNVVKQTIEIKKNIFTDPKYKDIEIIYPSFIGISDIEFQKRTNEIIKEMVFEEYNTSGELDRLTWKIKYEIKYKSEKLLCLSFNREFYYKGAHPIESVFAINIDLVNNKIIKISEYLEVSDKLANLVVKKTDEQFKKMGAKEDDLYSQLYGIGSIKNAFTISDNEVIGSCYYFDNSDLIIILNLPVVMGNCILVPIPYSELKEFIKPEYKDLVN